jgi:hypothetical protein
VKNSGGDRTHESGRFTGFTAMIIIRVSDCIDLCQTYKRILEPYSEFRKTWDEIAPRALQLLRLAASRESFLHFLS